MIATFDTVIFYPMSYSNVSVYLQSSSIIIATGYFLGKSFSIQADYTQLKNYNYLLCDVSASTIIPVDILIPTANIDLAPLSNYNYISDLYDTQINQFYIINQPINYDLIASMTFNVSSSIFSNTKYTSITLYSNTSITLYSVSSITFYSSSISYTSITLYSYTSSTIYSYSSITSYTSTTIYAYSSSTIYSSSTVYSSITIYSYTVEPPIILSYTGNITSWSTTYSLTYNQTMIISFTNSQKIFVPLQLTGNDNYDVIISQNISAYNSGAGYDPLLLIYPNNTNASVIYAQFYVYYNGGSAATAADGTTLSGFRLGHFLDSIEATIINNSPFTKTIIFRNIELGGSANPLIILPAQIWNDYTTSWTMFGTIVLGQTASGYIKIKRIS